MLRYNVTYIFYPEGPIKATRCGLPSPPPGFGQAPASLPAAEALP